MNKFRTYFTRVLLALFVIIAAAACRKSDKEVRGEQSDPIRALEYAVMEIPLPEKLSSPMFEYSGLGWHGDVMVLLPQYPNGITGNQPGLLYGIQRGDLINWKDDNSSRLNFFDIPFDDGGLSKTLKGFEGFESILFLEDDVYLTIETRGGNPMRSYMVKGSVEGSGPDDIMIALDKDKTIELPQQNNYSNASYEALTSDGEYIYALYEQYGESVNKDPIVLKIDRDLNIIEEMPIDSINYRITDASLMNENGKFWAINYFFHGDEHLKVEADAVSDRFGLPGSHENDQRVERLVKFRLNFERMELIDETPLYLELLANGESRNWEGLVVLDENTFVIVTDKFPGSLLAMVIIE